MPETYRFEAEEIRRLRDEALVALELQRTAGIMLRRHILRAKRLAGMTALLRKRWRLRQSTVSRHRNGYGFDLVESRPVRLSPDES